MTCAICLEKINKNIPKTECGHQFHINCIRKWTSDFIWSVSCPLCRMQIQIYPNTRSQKDNKIKQSNLRKLLYLQYNSLREQRVIYVINILNYVWKNRIIFRIHPIFRAMVIKKVKNLRQQIKDNPKFNIIILNNTLDILENF